MSVTYRFVDPSVVLQPGGADLSGTPGLPSGWTLAAHLDGSSLTGGSGFSFVARSQSADDYTSVSEAGAPYSPSAVLRVPYLSGFPGGSEPGAHYYNLGSTGSYIVWWSRLSTGFEGHSASVNKQVFQFFTSPGNPYAALRFSGTSATGYPDINMEWSGAAWLSEQAGGTQHTVTVNEWIRWEWLLDYSGDLFQCWITPEADGVRRLVGEITPSTDRPFPGSTFGETQLAPTWGGGTGPTVSSDQYLYIDALRVYTP